LPSNNFEGVMGSFEEDLPEWNTLTQSQPARQRRWSVAISVSSVIHGIVVLVLCWPSTPVFVKPNAVAHGEGGSATPVSVILYVPSDLQLAASRKPPLFSLPASAQKTPHNTVRKRKDVLEAKQLANPAEAGSEVGTAYDGASTGDDVNPALPVTFQDIRIPSADLPGGVQGDVIVEITIDAQGVVVAERLLQGLAPGVDERVIAALRDWRFHPATRNGVAISSKHDVYFHFPS
jgi:TonB family protein